MSSNGTLTILLCHDTSVHDCIPSPKGKPAEVFGIKSHHSVLKISRAYCRALKLDPEEHAKSLQLWRCFCRSSNADRASTLIKDNETFQSAGLKDGDRVFVTRAAELAVSDDSDSPKEEKNSASISVSQSRGSRKTPSSLREAELLKSETIELLGGDAFLSSPVSNCTFRPDMGITFWGLIRQAVRLSLELPGSASREKGQFPKILHQVLTKAILERKLKISPRDEDLFVQLIDLKKAVGFLRKDSTGKGVPSLGTSKPHLSESQTGRSWNERAILKMSNQISELWGNKVWKDQKIEDDLSPLSTKSPALHKTLLAIALLTPGSYSNGFPPLVLDAFKRSLATRRMDAQKWRRSASGSPHGWPQGPVAQDVLETIQEAKKKERKRRSSSEGEEDSPPETSAQHSTSSRPPPSRTSRTSRLSPDSLLTVFEVRLQSLISLSDFTQDEADQLIQHADNLARFLRTGS